MNDPGKQKSTYFLTGGLIGTLVGLTLYYLVDPLAKNKPNFWQSSPVKLHVIQGGRR